MDDLTRTPEQDPNDGKIQDVDGQQRWDIDPNADGAEEIAGDIGAYEWEMRRREALVYDESKSEFCIDCSVLFDWKEAKEAGEDDYITDRFLGASISFLEINETDADYFQTIGTATLIEDSTLIFKNGDAATALKEFPSINSTTPELRPVVICSALAVLCVKEVFDAEFFPRFSTSSLPIKRRRSFLRSTSKKLIAALTRETKDRNDYCLRGQRGAHGSESFRENVREFVRKELKRLTRLEFSFLPVERKGMEEFRESVIATNTAPAKLKKIYRAALIGQTPNEQNDFIAQLQKEARESVFAQDDGNGLAALAQILLDERLSRVTLRYAQQADKKRRRRKKASGASDGKELSRPVANAAELDFADIIAHKKELETGYHPRGPEARAFAVYADTILKEQCRPHKGRDGEYHRIQTEKALMAMAVYKDPNKRKAIPLFAFNPILEDKDGTPLERPIWLLWAASDWFFLPDPLENVSFQKDVVIPAMFAKVYELTLARGMELSTAGALIKSAIYIASELQSRIDGAGATAREHKGTPKPTAAEGELTALPIPERHRRKEYLMIIREALAIGGIVFETTPRYWKAYRTDAQITSAEPEIVSEE